VNQFITRKIIQMNFQYSALFDFLDEKDIKKGRSKLFNSYHKQLNSWDTYKNSQWVLRNYLASKMILASTLMLNSLKYGQEHNLRITEPYLLYYSLLNVSRAVVYTNPNVVWKESGLKGDNHSKTINIVGDSIGQFNKKVGDSIKAEIAKVKEFREIFSYKYPAEGSNKLSVDSNTIIKNCAFLSEFAQLQSEVLESIVFSMNKTDYGIDKEVLKTGFYFEGESINYFDEDDWYRLDYISRKQPFPASLYFTMSEGMVEDFFGAWYPANGDVDNVFNPDENWEIIFPLP